MKNIRQLFGIFAIVLLEIVSLFYPTISLAGNLTTVKDTLQSSRMSFSGRVAAPTIAGSSHVWIATSASGNYTSITTAGLKPGDTLAIGAGTSYVIDSIIDADEFTITTTLATGDADLNDAIIYKAIPQHVISFVTNSAVNGGFFQVLIPAAASGSNDNLPDITGFDFNTGTAGTASNIGNYTFTTPVATASGTGTCTAPANYHCIEYHYTGTGGVGTTITLNIGTTGGANGLIAPAPSSGGRTAGVADTYSFIVKNFTNGSNPSSDTPTDDASGKIAVVEPVRVTATVDPSISFTIEGTTAGTHCSLTTNVPTTATAVPFGILTLNTFRTAAQKLTERRYRLCSYCCPE